MPEPMRGVWRNDSNISNSHQNQHPFLRFATVWCLEKVTNILQIVGLCNGDLPFLQVKKSPRKTTNPSYPSQPYEDFYSIVQ